MTNPPLTNDSSSTPSPQTQGITEIRQMTIASMLARGFSVKYVAKKLKMSESRIYHLLSDRDSLLNTEIKRILTELFAASDRRLINLYNNVLQKLDTMLSSSDEEKQYRAMDRIIKMFFARIPKNVMIQQYFGDQLQPQREFAMDDYILFSKKLEKIALEKRKERGLPLWPDYLIEDIISEARKERGLPELPDHSIQDIISKVLKESGLPESPDDKVSSHPAPEANAHSSQENSSPGNSAQDTPSQDVPSQEFNEFLKQLT